jgi:Cu+-exporting ATPase
MTTELRVEGMSCGGCAEKVRKALEGMADGISADVDHESGTARVSHPEGVSARDLAAAVSEAGYPAEATG